MNFENKLKQALKSNSIEQIYSVFSEIYYFYYRLVYFTIMKYISIHNDIEDLAQDVFVDFFNNLNIKIDNIKYYLLTSAKNKSINYLKSKSNNIEYSDLIKYKNIAECTNNKNYDDLINRFKQYLNDFEIEIIIQHIIYEYSFKELSKIYNKPINTIISIYNRAKKKLKERYESYEH